jgi:hypothetical protein
MITSRTAFASGAIFSAALVVSIFRRRKYHSFSAWWNAEGIGIWILASMFGGGLLISN